MDAEGACGELAGRRGCSANLKTVEMARSMEATRF